MADIVLTHGYFLAEDEKEQAIMKPYAPLGLMYVSAYLKQQGFTVELFDSTFRERHELKNYLRDHPGGILGLYTNLITRASVLDLAGYAKDHGWTVILGGPESANYPADYLEHAADVVVIGEGEFTLAELLPALAERDAHRLHGIAGLVFRDEAGEIVHNPAREQIPDINKLPWPDREAIDIQQYLEVWRTHHGAGSVSMITARGCPYKCTWCSHAVFGYSHRRRKPADCAAELAHIMETYQPEQVWYADDVFTISHPWLYDYTRECRQRGLRVPFETISRADRMMKPEVMQALVDLGCYRIWIGAESGSQRILDAMQRQVTIKQVQWATHTAQRYGIQVGMFLMWGYGEETVDDIAATIEHVKQANPDIFFTTVAYPIKNTVYYQQYADKVIATKPWQEATDRDYRLVGRHSRRYYHYADLWLRNEVAAFRLQHSDPQQATRKQQDAEAARQALHDCRHETEA